MAYTLVTGDTGSILRVTCKDAATSEVINLTGATVRAMWRSSAGILVTKSMTVTGALTGIAEYKFLAGEIAAPAMMIEIEVTDSGGNITTSLDSLDLRVRAQIG